MSPIKNILCSVVLLSAFVATPALSENMQSWAFQNFGGDADNNVYVYIGDGKQAIWGKTELAIGFNPEKNDPEWNGECVFDNCQIFVTIDSKPPKKNELVTALFSNGTKIVWQSGDFYTLDNYSQFGMANTNKFYQNVRSANSVNISYSDSSYRFTLKGSNKALSEVGPAIAKKSIGN